jgi:NTE family protein
MDESVLPPRKPCGKPCVGLILAGGGARAAYQVGVLKAIAEIGPRHVPNPFPIICGTSAGAINGAVLAIHADRFALGVRRMARVWSHFHTARVFRSDAVGIARSGLHWLTTMMLGGLGRYNPLALLDRTPLGELLARYVDCTRIEQSIARGYLRAFSVTASGYSSGQSVAFYQGAEDLVPWQRARRIGMPTTITLDHLMASSAIPFVFPAVKINREYFGDGSMRQTAPISPALHLGADRVLVIGVRRDAEAPTQRTKTTDYPSLAQVAGYVLDSIFLDSLDADIERLQRINKTITMIPSHHLEEGRVTLRQVDVLVISPSEDISQIAGRYASELPAAVQVLLRGVGAIKKSGSALVSYLLFEQGFTNELIRLGYADTMARRDEVAQFMGWASDPQANAKSP